MQCVRCGKFETETDPRKYGTGWRLFPRGLGVCPSCLEKPREANELELFDGVCMMTGSLCISEDAESFSAEHRLLVCGTCFLNRMAKRAGDKKEEAEI